MFQELTLHNQHQWVEAARLLASLTWVSVGGSSPRQSGSSSLARVFSAHTDEQVWGHGSASFCFWEWIFPKRGNVYETTVSFLQLYGKAGRGWGRCSETIIKAPMWWKLHFPAFCPWQVCPNRHVCIALSKHRECPPWRLKANCPGTTWPWNADKLCMLRKGSGGELGNTGYLSNSIFFPHQMSNRFPFWSASQSLHCANGDSHSFQREVYINSLSQTYLSRERWFS